MSTELDGGGAAFPTTVEGISLRAYIATRALQWRRECDDADALLRHLGLDPQDCRTDGGWLHLERIRTLIDEQREVADKLRDEARAMLSAAPAAPRQESARPDLIERLSYHALERDDMTLDDVLEYLANGWRNVRGRTERQMMLQMLALMAGQEAPTVDAAIDQLVTALAESKGWLRSYGDAIIRDAIDRTGEPVAWIDAADFETLKTDGWCVVHEAPPAGDGDDDHAATVPLYTSSQGSLDTSDPLQPLSDAAQAEDVERVAFERWADPQRFNIDRSYDDADGFYHRTSTRWAWDAWQARAALAAKPARQLVSVSSIDIERMIAECLPGGDVCDPQRVAEAIRSYCDTQPVNPTMPREAIEAAAYSLGMRYATAKQAQPISDGELERLAAEYIAADWTPDRYYRDMNLVAFARALLATAGGASDAK